MKKISSLLLIDDNYAINRLNELIVAELNAADAVHIAKNGQEALQLIEQQKICPDLIVTDINMPVMDGVDFVERYSQLTVGEKPAAVVVSSASNSVKELEKMASYDFVKEQLEKPISFETWQRLQRVYGN
ncbi:MAG: response regulator [Bacteroidota bacterium]